jgi:glycosyltransferase involved in cell wall biosynthesis
VAPDEQRQDLATRLIEFASVRCMDMGIAVSGATKAAWARRTGLCPDRIKVIYNGIDPARFRQNNGPMARQQLGLADACKVILVSARLHWSKGHETLLDAFARLADEKAGAKLLFLGGGDHKGHLEERVDALGLKSQVVFLGFRDNPVDYYFASDIVCLPTFALDALPYSLIEAMACRKPVVASRFAGIPEIVDDGRTGLLVPPRDPGSLASALAKLLKDASLREQMGRAGRARVEELFTEDRMIEETFSVYEAMPGGRP